MNKRYVIILVMLAIIVGAAALFMRRHEESAQPALAAQLGQPLLKNLKASAVASIVIREPKATLTLARKDKRWTLVERNGFSADLNKVTELVLKALELKIGRTETIGEKDRARLDLLAAAKGKQSTQGVATSLTFKAADGQPLAELLIGKKYFKNEPAGGSGVAPADGRYLMLPDKPQQVFVVSDPMQLVSSASANWISKDGFSVERVKSIEVKPAGGAGYKIERAVENADWKLDGGGGGEKLDSSKANSAAYSLGKVEIEDVAASDKPGDMGIDHPTAVTATTFDGLSYTLRIGPPENDRYKLQVQVEGTPQRQFEQRKDEKPEARAAREKSFAEETRSLEERVAREKTLKDYVLLVAKSRLADVLKKKSELIEQEHKGKKKS